MIDIYFHKGNEVSEVKHGFSFYQIKLSHVNMIHSPDLIVISNFEMNLHGLSFHN